MRQARLTACFFLGLAVLALGGCSKNSAGNVAHIRTVDACSNGGTATVYINDGTANGSQTFFQASPYLFIGSGTAGFQFTLSANSANTYAAANEPISNGAVYSVVVMGRADVASESDARQPRLVFLQDDTASVPSGSAAIRLVNAAPDSTGVDFYVNSTLKSSSVPYFHTGDYVIVPAGNTAIQIDQQGANTIVSGPQNFTLAAGKQYSIYLVEPSVAPPTFGMQLLSDSP